MNSGEFQFLHVLTNVSKACQGFFPVIEKFLGLKAEDDPLCHS